LKTDFGGLPIAFHLTGGEASDSRNFETLLNIGPNINPRAALGDKGYDSKSNREAARQRGICPAIPYRSNTKNVPAFFPKVLYKGRAVSSRQLANSNDSSALRYAARRLHRITVRSSHWRSASS
jgi:Transposase DDE domain